MLKSRFKSKFLVIALTLAFILVGILNVRIQAAPKKTITILQTGDIHGSLYPWAYKTGEKEEDKGLVKVASIVEDIRAKNPNTLLVDSGDMIQGNTLASIFKDRKDVKHPMMKVMNHMGYDAWVLGNHEFNYGLKTLNRIKSQAEFPVLSANIRYKKNNELFVKPYTIKEVGGIKVGILGLTTPNIPRWDGSKVASLKFKGMSKVAQEFIPEIKQQGADIIIALAHAGLEGRGHKTGGDKVSKVAKENPELAAIFIGHDHVTVKERINDVLVVAPKDSGEQVSKVDLNLVKKQGDWTVVSKKATHLETKKVKVDPEIAEIANYYHQETIDYVNTPIGFATGDFVPENEIEGIPVAQIQDTALLDLINRVQLKYADADISSAALFDTKSNIKKGPVSIKDAALIYKYSNTLYGVKVTGKELKEYMEWSARYYNTYQPGDITISFAPEIPGYNYDMFAGVEYKIDISKPAGERIVDLTYNGKPVRDDQTFKLAVNNYRYNGLKSLGIIDQEPYFKSKTAIRDFIIKYIKAKETIKPLVDNNWKITGASLEEPAREEALRLLKHDILKIPAKNRSWNAASINLAQQVKQKQFINIVKRLFKKKVSQKLTLGQLVELVDAIYYKTYTIKSGDTLSEIAQDYKITVETIIDLNQIENPSLIIPGQKVKIPSN
ncbi:5'-nucleotidase/2',3'-cyclic phosphodiesterase-like hydrolase [Halobacteroides halobius DSM 5150]|uniref:5'-nucleotidase/2',3'-cyclic phosphodiesterase-like hydrolase n=1 Tax=Halobacteroides halobius (strain ATCC 35273 / DSM 5150 / MD-1) TaxID=748449 RepID=L0K8I4_HALHC|nr:5'-nucleotidase C-terminal domain-containing protein [Halobacteroides halobius]AGB41602.1 5'-nucleotidase/2',3'-cyclic phosphodiesterase-like hydrolase [Halobacteroides halobius DSM 5150]